jgi:hypothetical protein
MILRVRTKKKTMIDQQGGLGLLLVATRQTQSHLFRAIEYMAISEQQLLIVRRINGKYKVHQIQPVIKIEYN